MNTSRRSFLTRLPIALGMGAGATMVVPGVARAESPRGGLGMPPVPRIKLSISSYSYWHFKNEKFQIEKVIDEAARLGVEGIDILDRHMECEDNAYLQKLKRHAFLNGIAFTCLSIHQSFVMPDKEQLKKEIDHTLRCIELAAKMGI